MLRLLQNDITQSHLYIITCYSLIFTHIIKQYISSISHRKLRIFRFWQMSCTDSSDFMQIISLSSTLYLYISYHSLLLLLTVNRFITLFFPLYISRLFVLYSYSYLYSSLIEYLFHLFEVHFDIKIFLYLYQIWSHINGFGAW